MKNVALIVAAGRGVRAGTLVPKQYQPLAGQPLLSHSIAAFSRHPLVDHIRVVIHPDDQAEYESAARGFDLGAPVHGGATRQDSVRLGLQALAPLRPDNVLIHDGARPLISQAVIDRTIAALTDHAAVIAALPLADTLKRKAADGSLAAGPDRTGLWRAQTPQAFRFPAILAAHEAITGSSLTDDAAVVEQAGIAVHAVNGDEENLKVTEPEDFARAERLLLARLGDVRVAQGFDVHAFDAAPGRPLMLGGVAVPHARGLAGHSDADVALHALTDALLGALAAGDIGEHFPPSDMRWRNAASDQFLLHAVDLVHRRGGMIAHLDLTIICEAPKIGPHRAAIQARIAGIAGIPHDRVAVKATTTEKLGFTGRGEGIAAQAVATVRLPG